MIYGFLLVYVMGGLAGPTLQGIMSSTVADNEQGELMGSLTSLQSLANIIGPLIMTGIFSYFTTAEGLYFPGSAFALGAIFSIISGVLVYRTIKRPQFNLN